MTLLGFLLQNTHLAGTFKKVKYFSCNMSIMDGFGPHRPIKKGDLTGASLEEISLEAEDSWAAKNI